MFGDIHVDITNYTPQDSLDDSLILLTTGKLTKKSVGNEVGYLHYSFRWWKNTTYRSNNMPVEMVHQAFKLIYNNQLLLFNENFF